MTRPRPAPRRPAAGATPGRDAPDGFPARRQGRLRALPSVDEVVRALDSESIAIECSLTAGKKLYVVTLAGPEAYVAALEPEVIGTLAVRSAGGTP